MKKTAFRASKIFDQPPPPLLDKLGSMKPNQIFPNLEKIATTANQPINDSKSSAPLITIHNLHSNSSFSKAVRRLLNIIKSKRDKNITATQQYYLNEDLIGQQIFIHKIQASKVQRIKPDQAVQKNYLTGKTQSLQQKNNTIFSIYQVVTEKIRQVSRCAKSVYQGKVFRFLKQAIQKVPLFMPFSNWRLLWDFLILGIIMYLVFFIPAYVAFISSDQSRDIKNYMPLQICAILFLIDILIQLNTCIYVRGALVQERQKVIVQYFKKRLLTEILGSVAIWIFLFSHTQEQKYSVPQFILLFFLGKITHFDTFIRRIQQRWLIGPRLANLISLVRLLLTVLIVNHLFSCIWIFIHYLQISSSNDLTWLQSTGTDQLSWPYQYLSAFYFTIVTMSTVGYGDITAKTTPERALSIFNILIACGVYGYFLNIIGEIIVDYHRINNDIKRKMYVINRYMQERSVSSEVQMQIRQYLGYYWEMAANQNVEEECVILQQLSNQLREQLMLDSFRIVLDEQQVFAQYFSSGLLPIIVPLIKEARINPEQVVYREGELSDCAIYFVQSGQVELYFGGSGGCKKSFEVLGAGQSFGALEFFTNQKRAISVRALKFSTLFYVRRQDFLRLLSEHKDDYEMYCYLRDQIALCGKIELIGMKCQACGSSDHLVTQCPSVHLVPNKLMSIVEYQQTDVQQQRQVFTKRSSSQKTKKHALYNYNELMNRWIDFFDQNEELFFQYLQNVRVSEDNYFFRLLNFNIYEGQIVESLEVTDEYFEENNNVEEEQEQQPEYQQQQEHIQLKNNIQTEDKKSLLNVTSFSEGSSNESKSIESSTPNDEQEELKDILQEDAYFSEKRQRSKTTSGIPLQSISDKHLQKAGSFEDLQPISENLLESGALSGTSQINDKKQEQKNTVPHSPTVERKDEKKMKKSARSRANSTQQKSQEEIAQLKSPYLQNYKEKKPVPVQREGFQSGSERLIESKGRIHEKKNIASKQPQPNSAATNKLKNAPPFTTSGVKHQREGQDHSNNPTNWQQQQQPERNGIQQPNLNSKQRRVSMIFGTGRISAQHQEAIASAQVLHYQHQNEMFQTNIEKQLSNLITQLQQPLLNQPRQQKFDLEKGIAIQQEGISNGNPSTTSDVVEDDKYFETARNWRIYFPEYNLDRIIMRQRRMQNQLPNHFEADGLNSTQKKRANSFYNMIKQMTQNRRSQLKNNDSSFINSSAAQNKNYNENQMQDSNSQSQPRKSINGQQNKQLKEFDFIIQDGVPSVLALKEEKFEVDDIPQDDITPQSHDCLKKQNIGQESIKTIQKNNRNNSIVLMNDIRLLQKQEMEESPLKSPQNENIRMINYQIGDNRKAVKQKIKTVQDT